MLIGTLLASIRKVSFNLYGCGAPECWNVGKYTVPPLRRSNWSTIWSKTVFHDWVLLVPSTIVSKSAVKFCWAYAQMFTLMVNNFFWLNFIFVVCTITVLGWSLVPYKTLMFKI